MKHAKQQLIIILLRIQAKMATLKIIPYRAIEQALAQQKETLQDQTDFNTVYHKREEIEATLPDLQHFAPDTQPWVLLEPWLDLIMASQGLQEVDVHRIRLPGTFLVQLIHASKLGLQMGRISKDDGEDLAKAFPKLTTSGTNLKNLIKTKRFFVRLDTCSLKDAMIGKGPVQSVQDLWMRLATSARGMAGIRDLNLHDLSTPIYMYLFPWNDNIKTELEYRVYCAPPAGKIAAISQYTWHAPWYHASAARLDQEAIANRLLENCRAQHQKIMGHPAMTEALRNQGFVFDVYEDPNTQDVRLIELNDFGAMSGCGACLFHWIRDARVMYGVSEGIEVRVTA